MWGRRSPPSHCSCIAAACLALMAAACGASGGPAAEPSVPASVVQTATPAQSHVSIPGLVAVAIRVMDPRGALCDTHRDTAPSDVNGCPYTDRLKAAVNARYQQAWSGHVTANPVLTPGPPCGPPGSTVVSYFPTPNATGGTVALVATCGGPATDPSASWQKLVIVSASGTLLVDDILLDPSHIGKFVSVYRQATAA